MLQILFTLAVLTHLGNPLNCTLCVEPFAQACENATDSWKCFDDEECVVATGYNTGIHPLPFFFKGCHLCDQFEEGMKLVKGFLYACKSCKTDNCNTGPFEYFGNETEIEEYLLAQAQH